jgi:hypothetical protein
MLGVVPATTAILAEPVGFRGSVSALETAAADRAPARILRAPELGLVEAADAEQHFAGTPSCFNVIAAERPSRTKGGFFFHTPREFFS